MSGNAKTSGDVFIYSTLTSAQNYTVWDVENPDAKKAEEARKKGGPNRRVKKIYINGGANLYTGRIDTPKGIMTRVSAADWELLKQNKVFKKHRENRFIQVENKEDDANIVASLVLEEKDKSAPLTPKTYASEGKKAPKSGAK